MRGGSPRGGVARRRKHSLLYYASSIPSQIWRHPNTRGHRVRALGRALSWQAYKRLVRRPVTIRIFGGMRLRCYPDSTSASNVVYFGDHYEFDEMHFVRRYLRPGDGFIDGGANIGTYSLLAARIVGPGGRVEAFEPSPVAAERLRENVLLNGLSNVRVHEAAISEGEGTVRFLQGWDVTNRVASEADPRSETVEVEALRLDDVLDREATYAMGKLDLEGSEVAALRGARTHLIGANPPVWEVEGYENQLTKFGSSRDELFSILASYGYAFFTYDALNRRLRTLDDPRIGPDNLFAVHRSARAMVLDRLAPVATEDT